MGDPFIGEVRLFGFDFAPRGWAACNGQLLPIAQNQALYALIGAQFGGDSRTNFNLPNLQGRVALGAGAGTGLTPRNQGVAVGTDSVAINVNQMPWHTHTLNAQGSNATSTSPAALSLAKGGKGSGKNFTPWNTYVAGPASSSVPLKNTTVSIAGGNQAHENRQPAQVLNYCIAVNGLFPSRS